MSVLAIFYLHACLRGHVWSPYTTILDMRVLLSSTRGRNKLSTFGHIVRFWLKNSSKNDEKTLRFYILTKPNVQKRETISKISLITVCQLFAVTCKNLLCRSAVVC